MGASDHENQPESASPSLPQPPTGAAPPVRRKYVRAVGPKLKMLLWGVFGLFAILGVNAVYLGAVTFTNWFSGNNIQNQFYLWMFLLHLALGLLIIVPVVVFGAVHMANTRGRTNRQAMIMGYALFIGALLLLATGVVLMRIPGLIDISNPKVRTVSYWLHVLSPVAVIWLFILHRLAGPRIKWKVGMTWGAVAGVFALSMVLLHSQDPRKWNEAGPQSGEKYFFPSLARTATGNFIPAETLMMDSYCLKCHGDIYKNWEHSAHRLSSFNNPAYEKSVLGTRKAMFTRDGHVRGSRFCAGCHDPVPFFSGAFDDPKFDDPNYELSKDSLAQAGITCTTCHAITNINSVRGNADYTIEEPIHYPFARSENKYLQWINNQLVKAKPDFHKKTFLKPLHKSAEFCGSCHKVHLPPELNAYKWLRGQNHYDAYHLSGVSGHGIVSFYYPPKAQHNCNGCHMPLQASADFGAKFFDDTNVLKVHDHQFPSANTALPFLKGSPQWVIDKHSKFNEGVMRVDIFGVKEGGTIDSPLTAPLRPTVPALKPGRKYLLETVIRTVKMGHLFTQGTVDSNEVWLDVKVTSGGRVIGRSGGMNEEGEVDPWSHFINVFLLDRNGNRIDRRNAEDIFVPLYNNQIPPGAGDVTHFTLAVPADVTAPVTVEVKLLYRKFDTTYMKFFQGKDFKGNNLPIMTLATDRITFPVTGSSEAVSNGEAKIEPWQRWNDYGIGLFRKGDSGANRGELRQAEAAFAEVEKLKRPDGPLNRARVYIKEGRLEEAVAALKLAAAHDPPAPAWSVAWFSGLVDKQNGNLDQAIENFKRIITMDSQETRKREFDFSQDYTVLNELGTTLFERAKLERSEDRKAAREAMLRESLAVFHKTLKLDPENMTAHFNLGQLYEQLGDAAKAAEHRALHAKYKPDDNARDKAVAAARIKYPAANHAAEAIVIYDLNRPDAYESKTVAKEARVP